MALIGNQTSRRGYIQCNERRVKWNESWPCNNCATRQDTDSQMTNNALLPGLSQLTAGPRDLYPKDWTTDLYLMHHYTSKTSVSFSDKQPIRDVWQTWAPQEAVSHSFLMHGLLATSALHLAHLDQSSRAKYIPLCHHHQGLALASFRTELCHITPSTCHAILALASLLAPHSMSVFAGEFYGATSFDDVMQQFVLIRGIERIMATKQGDFTTVWHWIMEGPMKAAMQGPLYSLPHSAKCAPALEKYFDGLRAMVLARCTGSEQTGPCFNAIRSLQKIYQAVTSVPEHVPKEVGMAWAWVTMVTQDFVELLQARHPVALVVLMHFTTLFVLFKDKWYVKGWSERSSSAIREQLPAEFWPEEKLPGEAVLRRQLRAAELFFVF